jgi:hypothetical protein
MSWSIEGRYFENCSCEVVCPCTASFNLAADYDRCKVVLAFHVDSGEVEGVDVGGVSIAAVVDAPQHMLEGNWRLGVLIDASASDQQVEKLAAVFGGQLGGPMAALAPLVGEQLGLERVAMQFTSEGGRHVLEVGDRGRVAVEDVVPFGVETGQAVRLTGVFHPAAQELNIAQASSDTSMSAFGIDLNNAGKAGASAHFAWAA